MKTKNALHDLIASGKMPVILELHLTEADRLAYQRLRQRHLAMGYELPQLTVLGQYLRQMDATAGDLSAEERDLVRKLQVYADLVSGGGVDLVALDDGSRGRDTLDNAIAAALLIGLGADPSRLMANVVARNRQADQIRLRLKHFADLGLRNALVLTGDLPIGTGSTARFPLDSVGMCELARRMLLEGELPSDFWIAAAGHPNPDADPDGMRTLQKAMAGAKVIITQAIYSIEQFTNWMTALQQLGVLDRVHVLGEVIPITSARQLRVIADVPGIRVPTELIAGFDEAKTRFEQTAASAGHPLEWTKQRLQQEGARVTRDLLHRIRKVPGVSGFYLGCVKGFEAHLELLREAPLLPEHGHSLHKTTKISGAERQRALADIPALETLIDTLRREAARRAQRTRWFGGLEERPWIQSAFKFIEWLKVPVFGCKKCDRCDLSPDALICPRGCAKQMTHGPCGAPRLVKGRMLCEDTSRECTWAAIRTQRERYGIPLSERLEVREAPSPQFYEGKTYSAFLPVLSGQKRGPNWSLAWRAPLSKAAAMFNRGFKFKVEGHPRDLPTLARVHSEALLGWLAERPDADKEELLVKLLALIGTPAAWSLIESRLAELGLPAEGSLADLSLPEQFQLAAALPVVRRRMAQSKGPSNASTPSSAAHELLAVIPEGRSLRQAMRRELANGLIAHIAALGVGVTYAESLLDAKQIDDFLGALTLLKDELQMARSRLPFEPGGLSVYVQRIHYKQHFQAPIALHWIRGGKTESAPRAELRIDLRQYGNAARFRGHVRSAVEALARGEEESAGAVRLEEYVPGLKSVCWQFNMEFWKRLREFEKATGKNYDASIGGSTDHNMAYVRSSARALFDKIHDHHLGDERLCILEIGVASTHRAKTFLGEFRRICELTGSNYDRKIVYVLADFSEELLAGGVADLSGEHVAIEAVKIDAADPHAALAGYRGQVIHAHLCNVYDNLPSDQVVWMDGRWYRIEVRAYVPAPLLDELTARHGFVAGDREVLDKALTSLGSRETSSESGHQVRDFLDWAKRRLVQLGKAPEAYVAFWMDLFAAIRLDERYVAVQDTNELIPGGIPGVQRPGEVLERHLTGTRDARVHLNQAALSGFSQLLPLLHTHGTLEVVDLFVQRLDEYHHAFKGPAKYDGSVVNWLNGPLFRAVAEHLGCTVRFQPFRPFDPKSVSVVMLAGPKG